MGIPLSFLYSIYLGRNEKLILAGQEDLARSERKFKSYFELPLTGVAIFDTEGKWIELNDRMCEILGYSREELLDFVWTEVTHPEDIEPCMNLVDEIKNQKREQYTIEKRYVRKSGEIIFVEISVGCIRHKDGNPEFYVALIQDIFERKNIEIDRNRLAQLKTEFLSTAAHELRTPLTTIRGFSELITNRNDFSNAEIKKYSKFIHEESGNLVEIIDDLLDISRIESGKSMSLNIESCSLVDVVNQEVETLSLTKTDHEFPVEIEGNPYEVLIDSHKIQQVLRNLYSNSIKYSKAGCEIATKIKFNSDTTSVSISDEGAGMTQDQLDHIFDKFYRAYKGEGINGTGLGMNIVRLLIKAHEGKIRVESEINKGTTVSFELPAHNLPTAKDIKKELK